MITLLIKRFSNNKIQSINVRTINNSIDLEWKKYFCERYNWLKNATTKVYENIIEINFYD